MSVYRALCCAVLSPQVCLEACVQVIDTYNELKPYTIVGLPASYAISTSIVSAAITFFSVLYGAYRTHTSSSSTGY